MRIAVIGGGPAGLYFALLTKRECPRAEVTVFERNAVGDTFGFGVVFSDETLGYLEEADARSAASIKAAFAHWDDIEVHVRGRSIRSTGHGFCGIARRELLRILIERAAEVGVACVNSSEIPHPDALAAYDIVVAADGVNSTLRQELGAQLTPSVETRASKFIWLGTSKLFDAFQFVIEEYAGGVFQAHAYRFDNQTSTFIVETDPDTWRAAGFETLDEPAQLVLLERIFAGTLGNERLVSNRSRWIQFPTWRCERWSHGNIVFMGDAVHTAHFSIGSGTKMAMEDAIALASAIRPLAQIPTISLADLAPAFATYEVQRRLVVEKTQAAAEDSLEFFENTARYLKLAPETFAFRLLTRSKKIGYDNLRLRDPAYVAAVDAHFARAAGVADTPSPQPMFTPFTVRGVTLANRVVVSPMCMYSAVDGVPGDFHLVHLGSRAVGGAGLILTEMTNVAADARITPGCTGLYSEAQVTGFRRVTEFVHANSCAKIGVQLGHAGRKGATKLMWEGMDEPLEAGAWPLISASAIPYFAHSQVPAQMDAACMDRVVGEFEHATQNAIRAGFDWLELHMAHGYLLASFLSPLTNQRTDEYGGSIENRMRYPLRVFDSVRAIWPDNLPMSVRISATDWHTDGLSDADRLHIGMQLKAHGCDVIDVSTGQTVPGARPKFFGRMFQTPFADQLRNDVGIASMAVGNITTADQCNTILAAGRADLVLLARGHLRDPYFTFHAAEAAGYTKMAWPAPYSPVAPRRLVAG
jgi:anthraniloyl-CoA monooxygenase